jgi:hypothetical protein
MTELLTHPLTTPNLRAKDIQMAASAHVSRRLLLVSGAIDVNNHAIVVHFDLPAAGIWHIVKSETNLTPLPWLTWQMTCDDDTRFSGDEQALMVSRQFRKTFMTPDRDRITFYDGEVRPGEAVLKMFTIEAAKKRVVLSHGRFTPPPSDVPGVEPQQPSQPSQPSQLYAAEIRKVVENGMPYEPVIELAIPVAVLD